MAALLGGPAGDPLLLTAISGISNRASGSLAAARAIPRLPITHLPTGHGRLHGGDSDHRLQGPAVGGVDRRGASHVGRHRVDQ
jgi:hypothetical protein